jgi:carboxymethylenebutenolidase
MKKLYFVIIVFVLLAGYTFYTGLPGKRAVMNKEVSNTNVSGGITKEEDEKLGPTVLEVAYYNNVKGFVAAPSTAGKHPAIILIHEWWGLNDDIKAMAEKFANEGYVAIAVDLYGGKSATTTEDAQKLVASVRNNTGEAFNNLKAAVAYLKTREDVDQNALASVGWCFGGGWSYQMAVNDLGTAASIMYYGQFDPKDDFEHMKAHILGHFGEKDASIKVDTVNEFQAKLKTANGDHEVYIYPNVGHGFANERGGTNVAYNKEAADLAWQRTLAFLKKTLTQ